MKTTIAIITIIAIVGLSGIAGAGQPTPGPGPQETLVKTVTPVLSTAVPPSVVLPLPGGKALAQPALDGYRVEIGLGYSVTLPGQGIGISFDRVVEDSRCPENVMCIWAGRAEIGLTVTQADTTTEVIVSIEPSSGVNSPWARVAGVGPESEYIDVRLISLELYPSADDHKQGVTHTAVLEIKVDGK